MAGHYFYDPRPFYGHTGYTGLVPLDELFYGRYDSTIPYWLDQRMMPFEENYYPGHNKQMGSRRGAEVMQQQCIPQQGENNFMAYNRPELVRDDMYADMYRRSPYNFNYNYGRDAMHPGSMRQPLLRQSQDDTWVHSKSAPATSGYGQGYRGLPEPPPGAMTTHFGNGNAQYRPMHHGGDQYTNIPANGHTMSKQSNMTNHANSHGNNHDNSHGNSHGNGHSTKQIGNQNGNQNGTVGKSLAKTGAMNTTSLKRISSNNAKCYDSSDSEDERGQRSSVKSQHGQVWNAKPTHGHTSNSSHSPSSNKKSTGTQSHNAYGGAPKRNNSQSKISKLFGFHGGDDDDDDSSSSESESCNGSSKNKRSSNSNNTQASNYQTQYSAQPKQTQSSSQSKPVELRVPICCDNCERKVRSCIEKMHGVETVLCDQWKRKVVIYGKVKADDVLKRVRRVKKTSELWQQAKQPQQQQQQQHQQHQQQQQQGFY